MREACFVNTKRNCFQNRFQFVHILTYSRCRTCGYYSLFLKQTPAFETPIVERLTRLLSLHMVQRSRLMGVY